MAKPETIEKIFDKVEERIRQALRESATAERGAVAKVFMDLKTGETWIFHGSRNTYSQKGTCIFECEKGWLMEVPGIFTWDIRNTVEGKVLEEWKKKDKPEEWAYVNDDWEGQFYPVEDVIETHIDFLFDGDQDDDIDSLLLWKNQAIDLAIECEEHSKKKKIAEILEESMPE